MIIGVQNRAVKTAGYVAIVASLVFIFRREIPISDVIYGGAMGAMLAAAIVMLVERFRWGWVYLAMSLWGMYSPPETHPISRVGAIVTLSVAIPMVAVMAWGIYRNVRDRRTA